MAIQTRYAGDSLGINNVDGNVSAAGTLIAGGLTKNPLPFKILLNNTLNFGSAEMVTGGAVETILRAIGVDSTTVMYQVELTGGQISVLLEATGSGNTLATAATALTTRLQSLQGAASLAAGPTGTTVGGNIGIASNVWAAGITVTSSGFKLA